MLNIFARDSISRLTDPVGASLVRLGLTPNAVTVTGAVVSTGAALWFFPRGQLFAGAAVLTVFLLFDLLDGAMARAGGKASPYGGVLDATCDRIVDGALFGPQHAGKLAHHRIDDHHRRKLSARQHIIAKRDLVIRKVIRALVNALVMAAHEQQSLVLR